ncbi:LytR/AlgR family response regulator transcription factor [Adhaeribacter radiodurans]|uniref:LytTR family transcriptional regulator n=1 Tax=Adhaeribacter radiodurans TaxID=2745197 RepID=A0A7L7L9W6_9BACT|nr:LytTR family DNA-binding domain-containing protein [Adhaeribacter radiodurans]QMU29618.1 LytTR family transcriptional regulator [Adhaeribacter radiodurans]
MPEKRLFPDRYYPDILLFLILIPFISAINYYLTYSRIQLNWFLALTFTIDTVQGYFAWLGVRYFILYLDKKLPYQKGALRRIIWQQVGVLFIGLLIISLLTEWVSWLAKGEPAPLDFYTLDLFIIGIWFFVVNGVYVGLHYYHQWQKAESRQQQENYPPENHSDETSSKIRGLVVRTGKQDIRLSYEELAGFYVDDVYVVACHFGGKKYYLDQSLDKIEKSLPAGVFFRMNRKFILHQQMVSGFKRAENGKLLVLLQTHECFPSEVPVSRTKAPAFKSWFQPE